MKIGSLFAGYGGLELGVQAVLGGTVAWHSEIDPGPSRILAHRHPGVPNLGDVAAVDWSAVEPVDVLAGGFPCQDVSAAGKRAGIKPDTRSGLWSHFAYAIDELRPGLVIIENVRGLLSADAHHPAHGDMEPCEWCVGDGERRPLRALGAVLGELADLGYDARWQMLSAADVGAPHRRDRVFVVAFPADSDRAGLQGPDGACPYPLVGAGADRQRHGPAGRAAVAADAHRDGLEGVRGLEPVRCDADGRRGPDIVWGDYEPAVRRWERLTRPAPAPTELSAKGAPRLSPRFVEWMMGLPAGWVTDVPGLSRSTQLKALGNGVVPQQAAAALRLLLTDHTTQQETAA